MIKNLKIKTSNLTEFCKSFCLRARKIFRKNFCFNDNFLTSCLRFSTSEEKESASKLFLVLFFCCEDFPFKSKVFSRFILSISSTLHKFNFISTGTESERDEKKYTRHYGLGEEKKSEKKKKSQKEKKKFFILFNLHKFLFLMLSQTQERKKKKKLWKINKCITLHELKRKTSHQYFFPVTCFPFARICFSRREKAKAMTEGKLVCVFKAWAEAIKE